MLSQATLPQTLQIEVWHIRRFVPYLRNLRKNDAGVDRMAGKAAGQFGAHRSVAGPSILCMLLIKSRLVDLAWGVCGSIPPQSDAIWRNLPERDCWMYC